jgi:uroporphyrinogen III methyltransferase/synthase
MWLMLYGYTYNTKVLIPRAKNSRDFLLKKRSDICAVKQVYTLWNNTSDSKKEEVLELLKHGNIDYIAFISSSTIKNFVDIIAIENIDKINWKLYRYIQ